MLIHIFYSFLDLDHRYLFKTLFTTVTQFILKFYKYLIFFQRKLLEDRSKRELFEQRQRELEKLTE